MSPVVLLWKQWKMVVSKVRDTIAISASIIMKTADPNKKAASILQCPQRVSNFLGALHLGKSFFLSGQTLAYRLS